MKIQALWLSASAVALSWGITAFAQAPSAEAPAAAAATEQEGDASEEVVVTAERRSTSLQRTPIAASVLTGEDLANRGVTTIDQLQYVAPGVTVNNFGQGIDFNIRGIGKAEHNTQTTTGVITYRDGVATFPGYFTAEPYYDVARVEILRGPQGTFVGQNATGGAVFVTTNNPVIDGGYHGYIAGQVGNYADIAAQGAMNLPISDTLAARISFNAGARDSFYDITGPYTGHDGRQRLASARLGVLWEPTDSFSALLKVDYSYLDMGAYPADPVNSVNDPFDITSNAHQAALDRFVRTSLKLDYVTPNGTTFRSISGYQWGRSIYASDLDGRSGPGAANGWTFRDLVDEEIYSQEFNIISPDSGRLTWIVGAYYQHDEYTFPPGEFVVGVPPGSIFSEYVLQGTNPKEVIAVFGQIGYQLTDALQVQLGLRYSDAKTTNHVSVSQYGTPITQQQTAEFSNLSGKLALNWTINRHHFLYAFVATGFRPGGLNVPVGFGIPAPFDEEKVTEYAIGWKAGWLDGQLRTQINGFYNDYEGFQVTIGYPLLPTFGFELNTPNPTRIYGVEAQIEAIFGSFSLDAGIGWMHSELGEFYATDPRAIAFGACDPETGPATASCINLDGRDQSYAPEFTFNIAVQYEFSLPNGDTLTPRVNFGHVSGQWATLFQNEARGDRIEERNILGAQIAWTHGDIVATLYGTNLTDQHYVAAINSGLRFAGPPRQFGIRIMKTF